MKRFQQWLAVIAAAVTVFTAVPQGLAMPAQTPFAEFHIDAAGMDAPERTISAARYTLDENGQPQPGETEEFLCRLNRVTGDAGLFIQTSEEDVWVTVDYLTDIDGDGTYELLEGGSDTVDAQGVLNPVQGEISTLNTAQLYILSPELLVQRSRQAALDRGALLGLEEREVAQMEFPVCMITLRRVDPADEQEYEQVYYLQIYGEVLVPFDLPKNYEYYDAVLFGLSQGYFGGIGGGLFGPDDPLNRAQLAQVLWNMSGTPASGGASFSDTPAGEWYYPAVSWCQWAGLINGYEDNTFAPHNPLTREQLASILYRYAQRAGDSLRPSANMSRYADRGDISPWAYESMWWAVSGKLINPVDGMLCPGAVVSRGELAWALYAYDRNLGLRDFW